LRSSYKIQTQQSLGEFDKDESLLSWHISAFFRGKSCNSQMHLVYKWGPFSYNGNVNKQNVHMATETPHEVMETPLDPQKFLVWYTVSGCGIAGPVFLKDTTNTGLPPCSLPYKDFTIPLRYGFQFWGNIFEKNKSWPHTENAGLDVISHYYYNQVLPQLISCMFQIWLVLASIISSFQFKWLLHMRFS